MRHLAEVLASILLLLGIPALAARPPAARRVEAPKTGAAAAPRPLRVAPFTTPATLSVFSGELTRAVVERLQQERRADSDAAPRSADRPRSAAPFIEAATSDSDPGVAITGRLEELPGGGVRLHANYQGTPVQATGDLEHIEELVQEIAQQLDLLLDKEDGLPTPPGGRTPPTPRKPGPVTPTPGKPGKPADPGPLAKGPDKDSKDDKDRVKPPLAVPGPIVTPPRPPDRVNDHPPERVNDRPGDRPGDHPGDRRNDVPIDPPRPPPDMATPALPPPRPWPYREPIRVAVHIAGEPIGQLPPGFYGAGLGAQQAMVTFLQRRLHTSAVPVRLVGLVGGVDALETALRARARFSLMARFDALVVTPVLYNPGSMTLNGRIHIVLLYDGKLRLDRSLLLPPTAFLQSEPAPAVAARAVTAVMESLGDEIVRRLEAAAAAAGPPALPGPPGAGHGISPVPGGRTEEIYPR